MVENGEWRRPLKIHSLNRSPNIIRVFKFRILICAGHVVLMEEGRSVFRIVMGKPAGKRPLGRPRNR